MRTSSSPPLVSLFLLLAACGGSDHAPPAQADAGLADATVPPPPPEPADAAVVPLLRHPLPQLTDEQVGRQALELMGAPAVGASGSCNDCHAQNAGLLVHWAVLSFSTEACLTDHPVTTPQSASQLLDCLRVNSSDPSSPFVAAKLSIYSAAAHLDWFPYVFKTAFGAAWEDKYEAFKARAGMPKGNHEPFTQAQFDVVAEWFARGLPLLDTLMPDVPPPADCVENIGPEVASHVATMKQSGWGAVNAENHVLMFGCPAGKSGAACLTSYPRASSKPFGAGWESLPGAVLRVLRENGYASAYWTRSSADGRFVGHGGSSGNGSSSIIDLVRDVVIPTPANFDPGFMPDNSAFMFQGSKLFTCEQSVLTANPTSITYEEVGCSGIEGVGLYQHAGATLGGGDYWVVNGQFESDDGGKTPTLGDPLAFFASFSTAQLTPMVHTGHEYHAGTPIAVSTPYEGDAVISPSSRLLISRLAGPDTQQRGYVLRRIVATPKPSGGYTVELPEVARYCTKGAKPNFSFDERWVVTHHYVTDADAVDLGFSGADDPGFQAYRKRGGANVYLLDLLTGVRTRITRMNPGQYALYPHFRSDGWIYFMVRTADTEHEEIVASDAALVLAP